MFAPFRLEDFDCVGFLGQHVGHLYAFHVKGLDF